MVDTPPPTIVTRFPSIVATVVLELVYVNAPSLLLVGGVMLKAGFPDAMDGTEKLVRTVVALFTWNDAVIVSDKYVAVLA
jgi:hypothetical protein